MSQVEMNDLDKQLLSRVHPLATTKEPKFCFNGDQSFMYRIAINNVVLWLSIYGITTEQLLHNKCVDNLQQMIIDMISLCPNLQMIKATIDHCEDKTVVQCKGFDNKNVFSVGHCYYIEELVNK